MDSHLDGSIWIDSEAGCRLSYIISTVDNVLFSGTNISAGKDIDGSESLLICQNIDTRATKENSNEWRDWTRFFSLRVVGTHLPQNTNTDSIAGSDAVNEDETIAVDECLCEGYSDVNHSGLKHFRTALLQGLIDSVLSECKNVPKFEADKEYSKYAEFHPFPLVESGLCSVEVNKEEKTNQVDDSRSRASSLQRHQLGFLGEEKLPVSPELAASQEKSHGEIAVCKWEIDSMAIKISEGSRGNQPPHKKSVSRNSPRYLPSYSTRLKDSEDHSNAGDRGFGVSGGFILTARPCCSISNANTSVASPHEIDHVEASEQEASKQQISKIFGNRRKSYERPFHESRIGLTTPIDMHSLSGRAKLRLPLTALPQPTASNHGLEGVGGRDGRAYHAMETHGDGCIPSPISSSVHGGGHPNVPANRPSRSSSAMERAVVSGRGISRDSLRVIRADADPLMLLNHHKASWASSGASRVEENASSVAPRNLIEQELGPAVSRPSAFLGGRSAVAAGVQSSRGPSRQGAAVIDGWGRAGRGFSAAERAQALLRPEGGLCEGAALGVRCLDLLERPCSVRQGAARWRGGSERSMGGDARVGAGKGSEAFGTYAARGEANMKLGGGGGGGGSGGAGLCHFAPLRRCPLAYCEDVLLRRWGAGKQAGCLKPGGGRS